MKYFWVALTIPLLLANTTSIAAKPSSQTIKLCDDDNWALFTSDALGNKGKGITYGIVAAIFNHIDKDHQFEPIPWRRCLNQLKDGSSDAAVLLSVNSQRMGYMAFTDPIISERGDIYYQKTLKKLKNWQDASDFDRLRIGLVGGYNYADLFAEASTSYQLNVTIVPTNEQGIEMLTKGHLDAFLTASSTGRTLLKRMDTENSIAISDKPYFKYTYHMGISRKSPQTINLIPQINEALQKLKDNGGIERILNKHFMAAWGEDQKTTVVIENGPLP